MVNRQIFNTGVRQQNVEFAGSRVVVLSLNTRVPVLKRLENEYPGFTGLTDYLLTQVFKKQIKQEFQRQFRMKVIAVFKDYDAETEYSATIICLDRDVEAYLNELPEL